MSEYIPFGENKIFILSKEKHNSNLNDKEFKQVNKISKNEKCILYGGPVPDENKFASLSIGSLLLEKLQKSGNQVMFINGETSKQLTASEILNRSIFLAQILQKSGIKSGDVIGICSPNSFEFIYATIACFMIGAIVNPFNSYYTEHELNHVLNISKPKLIFASSCALNLRKIILEKTFIEKLIIFPDCYPNENIETFSEFLLKFSTTSNTINYPCEMMEDLNETAVILFSSGTTGLAKGVALTHNNILRSLEKRTFVDIKLLTVAPWFHSFGFIGLITSILFYENMIFIKRFQEQLYLNCIEKYNVNSIFIVPSMGSLLASSPHLNHYNLSWVKIIASGSGRLTEKLQYELRKIFTNANIFESYGMTETTLSLTFQTNQYNKQGSAGILKRGNFVKVLDLDNGKIVGPHQHGELVFKSETIAKGYFNNPNATKELIDDEGWLHTGDIGYYDNDGEIFIVDRIKELIKYKGFQVSPAEIEEILLTHPKVTDAACVGLPDDIAGELPLAFVVLKQNETLSKQDLIDFVAGKVTPTKYLRGGVRFVTTIPKNTTGKILRKDLKKMLQEEKWRM